MDQGQRATPSEVLQLQMERGQSQAPLQHSHELSSIFKWDFNGTLLFLCGPSGSEDELDQLRMGLQGGEDTQTIRVVLPGAERDRKCCWLTL